MKDLVIFDFCETLIRFQTADKFVQNLKEDKSIKKNRFWIVISRLLGNRYFSIFFNKFFPEYNYGKRMRLLSLRRVKVSDLNRSAISYTAYLQKHLITPLYKKMLEHISDGDHVIIISGGYKNYIQHFAKEHGIEYVCATKIKIKNNYCSGTFDGLDCMHLQKLKKVRSFIDSNNIDFNRSIFYTDSKSDLALMQWVDKGIVVSKDKSQNWAKEYGFKEIIWKES